MRWYNGILWKVKVIEVMTENCAEICRCLDPTDDRPPVITLLFLKRLNNIFEENAKETHVIGL
jgi:hypothetical protein